MRLPGTRYQEHGWELVRKMLGHCSLLALARCELALAPYVDELAELLRAHARGARGEAAGNSYGESVFELALALAYELRAHPGYFDAFVATGPRLDAGDAILRKKVNDMFAGLRDKVDADNYQVACGRACSPNRIYTYRMLDTAYGEIARLFGAWQEHAGQVGAILGRPVEGIPIEVRQLKSIADCRSEWIIRWSETLEQFGAGAGPLHTRSKRFSSLKNHPETIGAMLREIGDYELLSSNRDNDWIGDANEASEWLEDLQRVAAESELAGPDAGPDQLLDAPAEEEACEDDDGAVDEACDPSIADVLERFDPAVAVSVSLPPRFMELASTAQERGSWALRVLRQVSLPVRLAVYLNLLGAVDDSYPQEWLDPASGALPTMQQLAALDQVSLPTLRKRRNEAIALLQAAGAP